ncbi:hypothetical protein [Yinghuangia soli]|uniref:Uncharacterized protein n=1 Tax=Yinghuangia soli TaxID=2908204 RepID=A0AA41PVF0_9ACTN|nr:hypothetical protein [Yinghuangia soli]MCF2526070.1 hypothetical protein [Yinghuangia soli]
MDTEELFRRRLQAEMRDAGEPAGRADIAVRATTGGRQRLRRRRLLAAVGTAAATAGIVTAAVLLAAPGTEQGSAGTAPSSPPATGRPSLPNTAMPGPSYGEMPPDAIPPQSTPVPVDNPLADEAAGILTALIAPAGPPNRTPAWSNDKGDVSARIEWESATGPADLSVHILSGERLCQDGGGPAPEGITECRRLADGRMADIIYDTVGTAISIEVEVPVTATLSVRIMLGDNSEQASIDPEMGKVPYTVDQVVAMAADQRWAPLAAQVAPGS